MVMCLDAIFLNILLSSRATNNRGQSLLKSSEMKLTNSGIFDFPKTGLMMSYSLLWVSNKYRE